MKMVEFAMSVHNHINPVALRKVKIVYNFGLSECYRVKASSGVDPHCLPSIFWVLGMT